MEKLIDQIISLALPGIILLILILFLILNSWLFNRLKRPTNTFQVIKNSIAAFIVLAGILAIILTLPITQEAKGQILSFLGIIVSAGIALSSTTVLGNLIAGIMNNSMKRFSNGDLIKIGDLQGRVVRRSAFHTEIQLEDSNFVTIPNLHIASNPVKLTRKTNTVISTTVSLGYDVPRQKIEEALKEAALEAKLKDPYVYILELGDFSVVYKIHGFLTDSTLFFSTSSLLNAKVMDVLHQKKIEIVSPTFMNQRRTDDNIFIPKTIIDKPPETKEKTPEELIFDEAIEAGEIEKKKNNLKKLDARKEELQASLKSEKDEKQKEVIKAALARIENLKTKIEAHIKAENEKNKD
ncbi:MAG TPA: mechanosensitive ion channel domain-containing protein [Salinivirga sp.]|uniref:mechanosensitive ion channel family protein n=1 Tax=Salinivirga sp. TaxID=1970192 RepID=UPI002B479563|nr:mechanosensitive ion channel domain-containing protein [Salinivirga sp.]HKK60005.1 mechanosensitive ion channel domain-containing protein [Salinivirga sp.]